MAIVRKRKWVYKGQEKSAWVAEYKDGGGTRRLKTFSRKKDAERHLKKVGWELIEGIHTPDADSVTVEHACELWIERCTEDDLEEATIASYESVFRIHINPLIGGIKLSQLTKSVIETLRSDLLRLKTRKTVDRAIAHLIIMLESSRHHGMIARNVAIEFMKSKRRRKRKKSKQAKIPEKRFLKAFADAANTCDSIILKTFAFILLFAGLRASEVRGITWKAINFQRNTLSVFQRADRKLLIGLPKTEASNRTIPLAPALKRALLALKAERNPGPDDLIFPSESGRPMQYMIVIKTLLDPLMTRAGLMVTKLNPDGTPVLEDGEEVQKHRFAMHALRHACASLWIEQGFDAKRIQTWMGHASIQTTYDHYGHLFERVAKDVQIMEQIEAELLSDDENF